MNLPQLLRDQMQELEDENKRIKIIGREAELHFRGALNSSLIKVITGVRRCGKSVFAYSMLKDKKFAYLNFDDERLIDADGNNILSSFYEVYGKDFKFIFLDEIQNMPNWELFVNRLKRSGFNLFITDSNSKLLSKELATHLTGRHMPIEIFPFSFNEYLRAKGFHEDVQTTRGISILKGELKKYIEFGGFPEIIVRSENPKIYLRELYKKIIEIDIVNRYNISFKRTFREIAMTLISNPARGISYNKIKNQFNIGSEHTIKNYISYLEESYLIFLLNRFSFKPVEIEKSEKKVYNVDTGIINCLSTKSLEDLGSLYENIVAVELFRRKSFDQSIEVYYWKNQQQEEVDFVVRGGKEVKQLIQVCFDISNIKTKEREIRALLKAKKDLKCKNLLVITDNYEAEEEMEWFGIKGKVAFVPLWRWLFNS